MLSRFLTRETVRMELPVTAGGKKKNTKTCLYIQGTDWWLPERKGGVG